MWLNNAYTTQKKFPGFWFLFFVFFFFAVLATKVQGIFWQMFKKKKRKCLKAPVSTRFIPLGFKY